MYEFNLHVGENVIDVFDNIWIKQNNNERNTTIALTDKRMLFLDYLNVGPDEVLRISRGVDYLRYKEVYFETELENIKEIIHHDNYVVKFKDGLYFEFDNSKLYELLNGILKNN